VPETAAGEARGWRTIDELGALVGAYCWLEHRIFEVTGAWATGPIDEGAELRVAAIPVAEASIMEVLVEARREGLAEIRGGRALLGRSPRAGTPSRHLAEVFKRSFTPERVTPAARPG